MELFIVMFAALMLSMIPHELAHLFVALKHKFEWGWAQVGFGPALIKTKRFRLCLLPVGFGVAIDMDINKEDINYQKQLIEIFTAGVLVNMLLALIFMPFESTNIFASMMVELNIMLAISNVVPFKYLGMTPDGYRIKEAIKKVNKMNKTEYTKLSYNI